MLAAWDFLAGLLLVFPLVTGGVWIKRPGLFLELADIGIPTLLVLAFGLWLHFKRRVNFSNSFWVDRVLKLWSGWTRALATRPVRTLGLVAFGFGALWSFAALRRHWNLESNSYDLGLFNNAIWNLTHGYGYVSTPRGGINLFTDHQSPIFWLLAPVYWLVPRPETLLIVQAFVLASGGIAVFFLARQALGPRHGFIAALPLLYWAYRPIRNANLFDFHPEVALLPLFLFAIAGLQSVERRFRLWGWACFVLALASKESAGPIAAGIALAWFAGAGPEATRSYTRKIAIPAAVLGIAVFLFDLMVVPRLFEASYGYASAYGRPAAGFHLSTRVKFLFWTLGPLGFVSLFNWRALLAALPAYLMLFLTNTDQRVNILFHYGVEPAVGVFWAAPLGFVMAQGWLKRRFAERVKPEVFLPLWVLVFALGTFGRSEMFMIRRNSPDAHRQWVREKLLPCVDPNAPIAAVNALVPQLSSRHFILQLPVDPTQSHVDCVVDDTALNGWLQDERLRSETDSRLRAQGFVPALVHGSVSVMQAPGLPRDACLKCVPKPE